MLHPPPIHLSAPSGGSWFFTILCVSIFLAALAWAGRRATQGDWLALAVLAGGLVANLIEAELDNLGLLWFARDNQLIVFHSFGRYMPLYVTLGYGFYFGAITYFVVDALRRGRGARYLWGIYLFGWLFDCALESTGSWVGLYKYYGPQPYNVWGIPLWWMFVNPALPIAVGRAATADVLRRDVRRGRVADLRRAEQPRPRLGDLDRGPRDGGVQPGVRGAHRAGP